MGAPTRSRTSRLRHRRPVLCPAELWTRTEAPTGIEPAASWVEARCSIRDELRSHTTNSRLAWTGSNRSTSPMSRGRSAAELQATGCRARTRTWTTRVNSSTRYRLAPRGSGGEKGIRTPAPAHVRRPTWVATRPLQPDLGTSPRRRERESNAHVRSYPTSVFETVAPASGQSLHQVCSVGWSRRPTSSIWARRSAD